MSPRCLSLAAFSLLFLAGSAEPSVPSRAAATTSNAVEEAGYVDARSYFTDPEEISSWYDLTLRLRNEFDAICGDTFCEGDFSNYESLGFRCSVERSSGTIGECVWMFAASIDEVLPDTGVIAVENESWRCPMPVAAGTSAEDFLGALATANGRALYAALPNTERVLYDGLTDCL